MWGNEVNALEENDPDFKMYVLRYQLHAGKGL